MKSYTLIILVLLCSLSNLAQEQKELGVFVSDTTWLEEIIEFPISFAPEINYEGYEDLRFAKKWRDQSHEDFWCYTFAWHIKGYEKQNTETLETNIKFYYDGIMTAVNKKKDFIVPKTIVSFIKNDSRKEDADYTGIIEVYDAFNTEDVMTLNVRVNVYYCDHKKSTTVVFKLSSQKFEHDVWERFKDITLNKNTCN